MTTTTPNMNLVLPDVSSTVGPTWATLLNAAYSLIDSHDHSSGEGVRITPTGLNISSDLTFAQNNATNLRTARLYNNSSITLGVNDKTCIYSLNNELYFVDGNGNNVQITLNGAVDISTGITALTLNDSAFYLQYFGDTTKKFRFNASAIPTGTSRVLSVPDSGSNDTFVTQAATQTLTNKTLTAAVLSGSTATNLISGSGTLTLPTSGTVTIPNGTDTLVNLTGTQTLTGKILTGNNIASFTPDGGTHTITVPTVTDTLVGLAATQTLTNKVLTGNTAVNLISGSGTVVLNTSGTITVPNGTDTLVGKATTDTLTNKTMGSTNTLTGVNMASITPDSGSHTVTFPAATDTLVGKATTDTLSNKSVAGPLTILAASAVKFNNSANTFSTSLTAGANIANVSFALPISDGSGGQALTTNGSAVLGWSTLATVTGNVAANDSAVVFTNSDNRHQSCLPTTVRTYTLPTTSISAGDTWDFDNQSLFIITVNSSGGNLVGYIWPRSSTRFVALVNTPTTAANWNTIYESIIPAIVQANDATTTFVFTDNQFQISTPTAARSYVLPTTGVPAGYQFDVYNQATNAANYITLQSSGGNTLAIIPPLGRVSVIAATSTPTTAANWIVLQRESQWVTYTPAFSAGFGTVSSAVAYYKIQGDSMWVRGSCTAGTTAGNAGTITIPAGFAVNSAKLSLPSGVNLIGFLAAQDGSSTGQLTPVAAQPGSSTTAVFITSKVTGSNLLANAGTNVSVTSGDPCSFQFEVPIA